MTAVRLLPPLAFRNDSVRRLRRLIGGRRARWDERRFVVEGPKLLEQALACGVEVETVFVDVQGAGPELWKLAERCRSSGVDVLELQAGVLDRVCDSVTPQPVAAIMPMLDVSLASTEALRPDLVAVCAGLQDPGNAGAIVRSAGAAGAGAVVFTSGSVDVYNPKAVRSSAGALFHVPVVAGEDAQEVVDSLGRWGLQKLATVARGGCDYTAVDMAVPTALVFGSEATGLPSELLDRLDGSVTVPTSAETESLNVAMAATVLLFEAARQRRTVQQ